jgi:hypothetical protein
MQSIAMNRRSSSRLEIAPQSFVIGGELQRRYGAVADEILPGRRERHRAVCDRAQQSQLPRPETPRDRFGGTTLSQRERPHRR